MSNKRIQVLHGDLDQKALEWLDAQTNMSATIRLMIHQASRGSNDDYVMKCAKESQGIFGGSGDTLQTTNPSQRDEMIEQLGHGHSITPTTIHAENPADLPNRLKELAETIIVSKELPEERQVSEISVEKDIPKVQPEPVQTPQAPVETEVVPTMQQPVQQTPPVQPEQKKTVDWDKMDDEKNDTISRMMADLGRN